MLKDSRTAKSIKNSSVALVFYFINLVLQFFSRKIFLDDLGTEILGLNTTVTNLLQFLNLAELGIGVAVGFSLYKPFYEKDEQTINEIVALQGKLYRRIAYIVIAGSAVLMTFFPWIFAKMPLPLWYAYASFGVLLFSALLSYFVNYKEILLSADQKEYKIQYSYKSVILAKILVQILAIKYLGNGYVWWLVLELLFAIIASYALNHMVRRTYSFLRPCTLSLKELNAKYPTLQIKIKQVFVHKIAGFALIQISPLIIYALTSLTLVALYGNYMLIFMGLANLAQAMYSGISASIGNLVAGGDRDKIMTVFEELFSIRFFITAIICFGMMSFAQPFVVLWLGQEYLLPTSTLLIITANLFIYISDNIVTSYLNAYGFYGDIGAPIVEAILNIALSVIFGYRWGLNGVLLGVLISLIVIHLLWKPFFLFRIKLGYGFRRYIRIYFIHIVSTFFVAIVCIAIVRLLSLSPFTGLKNFIIYALISLGLFSILLLVVLSLAKCGVRLLFTRLHYLLR